MDTQHDCGDTPVEDRGAYADLLDDVEADARKREPFSNAVVEIVGSGKKKKPMIVPRLIGEMCDDLYSRFDKFPRRLGSSLFVYEKTKDAPYRITDIHNESALAAWIQRASNSPLLWHRTTIGLVTMNQLMANILDTAKRYEMVTMAPHYPERMDVFYTHEKLPSADEDHAAFWTLIGFFNPATPADKLLIASLMLAPLWYDGDYLRGISPSPRPGYIIDTEDAQGSGKSSVVKACAWLYGEEPIDTTLDEIEKGDVFKKRVLSSEGRRKRIVLIDNATGTIKGDKIASTMTGGSITGMAPYGHGEETRPNDLTFTITMNGATVDTDMATRCYFIKVRAPENADSKWEDNLKSFILNNRSQIYADGIDMIVNAPLRNRQRSRFPGFDAKVLSAVCRTDEEFAAVDKLIMDGSSASNVDAAAGVEFTALVEKCLATIGEEDKKFDSSRPSFILDSAIGKMIENDAKFSKWSVAGIRMRLLKQGHLPKFSRGCLEYEDRRRCFYYGMHLQGDRRMVKCNVIDRNLYRYEVIEIHECQAKEK